PGKADTATLGINNAGLLVGGYGVTLASTKAFKSDGSHFKTIQTPSTHTYVYGSGINNLGEIVGYTLDGQNASGFISMGSAVKTIVFPGSTIATFLEGVNDSGTIVGWYEGCNPSCANHAFVLQKGKYVSFDYPGALATFAEGINASGQIV